jgi:hypothetical protein
MNFKKLIVLFATTLILTNVFSQGKLLGKWYMFSRNRVIQIEIANDTLFSRQLNWDLTKRNSPTKDPEYKIIDKTIEANNNIYLCLNNSHDKGQGMLLNTIKIIKPNKEIILVINSRDSLFSDTVALREYIVKDSSIKYGLTLYSETELHRLSNQPNVSQMTTMDFKSYATKFILFKNELDSLSNKPDAPSGVLYYGYSMLRVLIGQSGYNPLVTNIEFDNLIIHFQGIAETKEICDKMMK